MRQRTSVMIPARLSSTRLPGKALKDILGKPVIQRVYEGCVGAKGIDNIYVATPDAEIASVVDGFGGKYVMTGEHDTVLGRCAEASSITESRTIVVVQGDEPMVNAHMIELALDGLLLNRDGLSTLVKELEEDEAPEDPNMVKIVMSKDGYVLYATRAVIPGHTPEKYGRFYPKFYKQSCIMAFGYRTLEAWDGIEKTEIEKAEGIDIVRYLMAGQPVKAVESPYNTQALDCQEDLERIRELWASTL